MEQPIEKPYRVYQVGRRMGDAANLNLQPIAEFTDEKQAFIFVQTNNRSSISADWLVLVEGRLLAC